MTNCSEKKTTGKNTCRISVLTLLIASVLTINPAYAGKPDWAGQQDGARGGEHPSESGKKDKHGKKDKREPNDDRRGDRGDDRYDDRRDDKRHSRSSPQISINAYFNDRERDYARSYYREEFSRGNCPPGLAKKHNGCLPPGQAKKWHRGQPLGRDVVYYSVPNEVLIRLRPPPAHHEYVRVASDILLIAVGTGMVVDAIEDLER